MEPVSSAYQLEGRVQGAKAGGYPEMLEGPSEGYQDWPLWAY